MMNQGRFAQFEQRIEQLVEGSFARLFAGRLHPQEVATRLARAIEDNVRLEPDGATAPTLFTVLLNPEDHLALIQAQPSLAASLAETVVDLANRGGLRLPAAPSVTLKNDPTRPPRTVLIEAAHAKAPRRSTQVMQVVSPAPSQPQDGPRNPQLILQGGRYIPLNRPVVNLGRRRDNQIVIDDVRVSRAHAQLRLRFGQYVIYDLNSSGGTFVNDRRITECILKGGDVISLAGVLLVYINDDSSAAMSITDTQMRADVEQNSTSRAQQSPSRPDDDPTL